MKKITLAAMFLIMVSCASVGQPEKTFASAYAEGYKNGFQDGFEKSGAMSQKTPPPANNYGYNKGYNSGYNNYGYGYGQSQKGTIDYAVQSGNLKSVKNLVEKKSADVNGVNKSGYSPLQMASRLGFVEIVKYLIEKGASVNFVSSDNYTPLKEALTYKKANIAEVLLDNGADAKYIDNAGYSMLYWAAQSGNKKLVEMMIKKGASPTTVASNGFGPTLVAVSMGFFDVATYLLENGGNPDEADTYSGFSCLMYTVRNNRQDLVELIAAKTKNINFTEKTGKTALHLAVEYNRLNMVKALVKAGANKEMKDNNGNTPEDTAKNRGLTEILDFLKSSKKI